MSNASKRALAGTLALVWLLPVLAQQPMPDDVTAFIEQRTLCDHFREEPWPEGGSTEEAERRAVISQQIKRYCAGSDESLRSLKERYRDDRVVMQQLEKFETTIEHAP